jgi:hypothetical protein
MLEKTEGAIQNESSRATYNIGHTRHRTIKKTTKTTKKTKFWIAPSVFSNIYITLIIIIKLYLGSLD